MGCAIVVSTCLMSVQFLLIKKLTINHVPFFQVMSLRGAVQAVVCLPIVIVHLRRPLRTVFGESCQERAALFGLALVSFGGLSCAFASLALLNLAQMQVLQSTSPVMTALLAWMVVRERGHHNSGRHLRGNAWLVDCSCRVHWPRDQLAARRRRAAHPLYQRIHCYNVHFHQTLGDPAEGAFRGGDDV